MFIVKTFVFEKSKEMASNDSSSGEICFLRPLSMHTNTNFIGERGNLDCEGIKRLIFEDQYKFKIY